jgi:lipopolysaccharide transport system permease protein
MNRGISPEDVVVYTPDSSLRNPSKLVGGMLHDLWVGRHLAWRLALRDISAQYRQAALGLLWAFILPLANTGLWIFLNKSGIVAVQDTALSYPIYVFVGTMLWAIFTDAANAPLQQTTAAKPMLAKINFPREALIVSGVYQALFNAVIKLALLLPALWFFGVLPGWTTMLFPFAVISLILAGTALGLLLTPIGMLYTDIGKAFPLLMQLLMYLSPVVFAMPNEGLAATIFELNPITPLIMTARDWLTGMPTDFLGAFLLVNFCALLLLLLVWIVYRAAMPILIERMSA